MKQACLVAAAAALAFAAQSAAAEPFAGTVLATKIGYRCTQYTIKNGHILKNIAVPVTGRPVRIMVTDVTPYFSGVGEATLMATTGTNMLWIGSDTWSDANHTVEQGASQGPGVHLLWADYAATVDVQVQNQQTLQIHNKSGEAQTVIVTFIW